jgi:hypothetical protein
MKSRFAGFGFHALGRHSRAQRLKWNASKILYIEGCAQYNPRVSELLLILSKFIDDVALGMALRRPQSREPATFLLFLLANRSSPRLQQKNVHE